MAARSRLPLLCSRSLPLRKDHKHAHTEAPLKAPSYPPVVPSLTAKSKSARQRQAEERVRKIRASPVEEKISLLTRVQWMKFVVYPQTFARNADKWYQHFTKTAFIPDLPERFGRTEEMEEADLADVRSLVSSVILQDCWHLEKRRPYLYRVQEHTFGPLLRNLVAGLAHSLTKYNPQLLLCSLDFNPQVHFYWRRGQRIIPLGHRKGHLEPTRFQIDDCPHSQIRITQQLKEFTPLEDSYAAEVPEVPYAPNLMPLFKRQYDNHIFTGSKLPDPARYGHTQFHLVPDRYHRDRMARQQQSDQVEVFLRANAIASLFAWTGAQAMYQGFWDQEDVTRPFVSQAVLTDGKYFSFFCYQLNTVALSVQSDSDNPRKNLLWGTESLKLYDSVEDGKVVGLNDDVIKLLVRFLMNQP